MLSRPIFEILGIALISAGILLVLAYIHNPVALLAGSLLLVAGLFVIYRHYEDMGTDPDILDYTPGAE